MIGSLFILFIAIIVLLSTFHDTILGEDDSVLTNDQFRVIWYLLIFSGVFFTLGSAAFLRAVNDPPMKSMFKWYHISTDELVGAWCFLLSVLPAIPYSLIYLLVTRELVFLGMLAVSILVVIACYIFVLACYPSASKVDVSCCISFI